MQKFICFFTLTVLCLNLSNAQQDTLIIKFNKLNPEMIHGKGFFWHPKLQSKDSLSYSYSIKKEFRDFTVNVSFGHRIRPDFMIKKYKIKNDNSIKKVVDSSYLKDKEILGIDFFRNNDYQTIVEKFEGKNRDMEDNPFVWLYDVDEIKNGKVLLRQVWHIKHIDE